MSMLDIFATDAYNVTALTAAINKAPYKPQRLGAMGLFEQKGISTLTAVIEDRQGRLSILPTAPRGSEPTSDKEPIRTSRQIPLAHIPANDSVLADEVQDVRAFGEESVLETVAGKVNDKLIKLRRNHEVTQEYHRVGAIQGQVLDADGSTVLTDLFTLFGITETHITFDWRVATAQDIQITCLSVIRDMEDALGADTYDQIYAFCGNDFFDELIHNAFVQSAYKWYQENSVFARQVQSQRQGFMYGDIMWINYRGSVGSRLFVPTDDCRFIAGGVPELFQQYFGPADFVETVNTVGLPIYAKQEPKRFGKGIDIHTQSNPLTICTRPQTLIRGRTTNGNVH